MNKKLLAPLLLVAYLTSCNQNNFVIESKVFYFDTYVNVKLFEGEKKNLMEIEDILSYYDKVSDNYREVSGVNNVSTINKTNGDISIDPKLYEMLKTSFLISEINATYFNPLCGSLAKKWKDALSEKRVLDNQTINEELNKMNSSSLTFKDNYVVNKIGEAEIDLGGIAKGYVLDEIYSYLSIKEYKHYLVNAGASSILLGEKKSNDGYFNVGIDSKILPNSYLKLKNCFVSTSSISEQGVKINEEGPTYSHIINPLNGSAINEQDAVIVVSNKGYVGDVLATSMMMNTVEEIKVIEKAQDIKCVVIKDNKVIYINNELEVLHH